MSELMIALEYVRTYLDDLLIITKASLSDHLDKLKTVLTITRLQESGLKINAGELAKKMANSHRVEMFKLRSTQYHTQ